MHLEGFIDKCGDMGFDTSRLWKAARTDVSRYQSSSRVSMENLWSVLQDLADQIDELKRDIGKLEKKAVEIVPATENIFKRPVSGILGRTSSPLTSLILGTTAPLQKGPTKKDISPIAKAYKEKKDEDELAIYANEAHPIDNLVRMWRRRNLSVPGKLIGSVLSPLSDLQTAMTRGDYYNPFAHSITSYTNEPAVIAHEMGHARDFASRDYPTLYSLARMIPFMPLGQEAIASSNAIKLLSKIKKLRKRNQIRRANRILSGGFGSYAGSSLFPAFPIAGPVLPLGGALVGQGIGHLVEPFGSVSDKEKKAFILGFMKEAQQQWAQNMEQQRPQQKEQVDMALQNQTSTDNVSKPFSNEPAQVNKQTPATPTASTKKNMPTTLYPQQQNKPFLNNIVDMQNRLTPQLGMTDAGSQI